MITQINFKKFTIENVHLNLYLFLKRKYLKLPNKIIEFLFESCKLETTLL